MIQKRGFANNNMMYSGSSTWGEKKSKIQVYPAHFPLH